MGSGSSISSSSGGVGAMLCPICSPSPLRGNAICMYVFGRYTDYVVGSTLDCKRNPHPWIQVNTSIHTLLRSGKFLLYFSAAALMILTLLF